MDTKLTLMAGLMTALVLAACGNSAKKEYAPQPVAPLYDIMYRYAYADSAGRDSLEGELALWAPQRDAFMKVVSDAAFPEELQLQVWSTSLPVEIFTPVTDSVFENTAALEADLGVILGRAADEGLELPRRDYAAVVYGRARSVLFVDSVMLIALNHYLGAEYDGYGHWPVYERLLKEPYMMPYDIAEALVATSYPYEGGDNANVLSRLLYEGALAHAKMLLVPDAEEKSALGYVDQHYQYLDTEEKQLWQALIERRLLFDTSENTVSRLVDPAPVTSLLAPYCPGRAGRFIGYRIVKSYLHNNPGATLPYLLSPEFYSSPDILEKAGYNP